MLTIVITGTSRGIGNQLAKYYLSLGHKVVGISRSFSDIVDGNYVEFASCVSNEQTIPDIITKFNPIDVLINNAGIASMNHTLLTPIDAAVDVMDTNFMGTFLLSKECAKRMMGGGRIINFTTVAYPLNLQGEAIYSASKAAIESLTKTMAYELAPFGITVNAIGPNPIETDLIKSVPKEKIQSVINRQAIKRFGTVEDIENVIDFLIKPESNFITGQVIYLGGIS
jgi:3-oxoacyl-[acyl-carrier protein] reductase